LRWIAPFRERDSSGFQGWFLKFPPIKNERLSVFEGAQLQHALPDSINVLCIRTAHGSCEVTLERLRSNQTEQFKA
jgi:hypothetical protein